MFLSDNATIKLGVGKNMVRSIRFWALANKIIEQDTGSSSEFVPTALGHAIFRDKNGLDPYLEDPQTLWILHWLLFSKPCSLPVWWLIMNKFPATNIKIKDINNSIQQTITNMSEWKTPSSKSIEKDVNVFIHTYTTEQGKLSIEDYLDCPFRQLHMIRHSKDMIRFVFGKKYGMSAYVVAFASLDFIKRANISSKSISITRLATESGSVGNIFKVGENDITDMLNQVCNTTNQIQMKNINGVQHLVFDDSDIAINDILGIAYNRKNFKIQKTKRMEKIPSH